MKKFLIICCCEDIGHLPLTLDAFDFFTCPKCGVLWKAEVDHNDGEPFLRLTQVSEPTHEVLHGDLFDSLVEAAPGAEAEVAMLEEEIRSAVGGSFG